MPTHRRPFPSAASAAYNPAPFQHPQFRGPGGYASDSASAGDASSLMMQNDDHSEQLAAKVALLKEISVQIGDEVSYQTNMLHNMSSDFDSTASVLAKSIKQIAIIARSPNGRWMCYLVAFVVSVLMYIVFIRRWFM
ncbi:protein transport protein bet1 [Entophlyctis luteolus]|nr:protein transport protein bet1 [Entophlyctis luteolus]